MTVVRLWGTRGSVAAPGPDTARYGGNTSCVEVRGREGTALVLDAGTGLRRLGDQMSGLKRVDLLLTHLHMDHLQGLGFFAPIYGPEVEVHIWGPASTTQNLEARLARYLSPPLFPIRLRELPCRPILHEVPRGDFDIGEFRVSAELICHPGPTVGYRIAGAGSVVAYLPDHEPALGARGFPLDPEWTSGYRLAREADLLLHDSQYSDREYPTHVGWGHSTLVQAMRFGQLTGVRRFVPFHHDPWHNDEELDELTADAIAQVEPAFPVLPGQEGAVIHLGAAEAHHRHV